MINNLSKDKIMNFCRPHHNFLLLFFVVFSMWTLADTSGRKYHLIFSEQFTYV